MGQHYGTKKWTIQGEEEKNFGFDFSFSNISCIFALCDICLGEYGLISYLCYIFNYSSF